MSRITKDIAQEVATKLVQKRTTRNNAKLKEIQVIITACYEASLPLEIIKIQKNFPDWLETTRCVKLLGEGLNYDNVNIQHKLPRKSSDNYYPILELTPATAQLISKKLENYNKEEAKIKEVLTKTEAILYELRTFAKVIQVIPEAQAYLPKASEKSTALMNIDSLRKEFE